MNGIDEFISEHSLRILPFFRGCESAADGRKSLAPSVTVKMASFLDITPLNFVDTRSCQLLEE
jgi:hypothetical protein